MHEAESHPALETSASSSEFADLMQAFIAYRTTLTDKMDHVYMELGLIRRDLDTFRGRMAEVEQWILWTEDVQRDHLADIHMLKAKVKHLTWMAL